MPKGTQLWIPTYAIHHDPEFYPKPEVFDPERFTAEMQKERNPTTYLPFGEGPRNCIGDRFGLMQTRMGLIKLLHSFMFKISPETTHPLKIAKTQFILASEGGLWLNVTKINK